MGPEAMPLPGQEDPAQKFSQEELEEAGLREPENNESNVMFLSGEDRVAAGLITQEELDEQRKQSDAKKKDDALAKNVVVDLPAVTREDVVAQEEGEHAQKIDVAEFRETPEMKEVIAQDEEKARQEKIAAAHARARSAGRNPKAGQPIDVRELREDIKARDEAQAEQTQEINPPEPPKKKGFMDRLKGWFS